jgi:hypothetical protein
VEGGVAAVISLGITLTSDSIQVFLSSGGKIADISLQLTFYSTQGEEYVYSIQHSLSSLRNFCNILC